MPKPVYSQAFKDKIVKEYLDGKSSIDIAKEYNISDASVSNWVKRAGNQMRPATNEYSKEIKNEIVNKYLDGKTSGELSKEYNIVPSVLLKWIKKENIEIRGSIKYDDEFKNKMVQEYLDGKSTWQLEKEYKVSNSLVAKWIRQSGNEVRNMSDAVSLPFLEVKQEAIELYKEIGNASEVARQLGVNHVSVCNWIRDAGLELEYKFYDVNHNFFSNIDTEDKAFCLGYILADGCIRQRSGSYILSMSVAKKDKDILEKVSKAMESTYPIHERQPQTSVIKTTGQIVKGDIQCILQISSRQLFDDLVSLGITPNKSLIAKPIKVRDDLQRHFWRGIVDGDGSLSLSKGKLEMALYGTEDICKGFSKFLGYNEKYVYDKGNIKYFRALNNKTLYNIHKLYHNASIYLDRKYYVYVKYLNKYNIPI